MIPNPDRHITGNYGEDLYLSYEDEIYDCDCEQSPCVCTGVNDAEHPTD